MCVRVCGTQEVLSCVRACVLRGWYSRGSPRDTRGWTDGTQEPLKRAVHVAVLRMLAEWLKLCCVVFCCSDGALQVAAYLVLVVARSGRIMLLLRTQA